MRRLPEPSSRHARTSSARWVLSPRRRATTTGPVRASRRAGRRGPASRAPRTTSPNGEVRPLTGDEAAGGFDEGAARPESSSSRRSRAAARSHACVTISCVAHRADSAGNLDPGGRTSSRSRTACRSRPRASRRGPPRSSPPGAGVDAGDDLGTSACTPVAMMRDAPHTGDDWRGWRRRSRRHGVGQPRSQGAITVTSRTSWSAAAKKAGRGSWFAVGALTCEPSCRHEPDIFGQVWSDRLDLMRSDWLISLLLIPADPKRVTALGVAEELSAAYARSIIEMWRRARRRGTGKWAEQGAMAAGAAPARIPNRHDQPHRGGGLAMSGRALPDDLAWDPGPGLPRCLRVAAVPASHPVGRRSGAPKRPRRPHAGWFAQNCGGWRGGLGSARGSSGSRTPFGPRAPDSASLSPVASGRLHQVLVEPMASWLMARSRR